MADWVTNRAAYRMARGEDAWQTNTYKMALLKSSYAPTAQQIRDLNVVNDLVPGTNELSVAGYSRQTLANKTVTEDDTNNRASLDCDDVTFTGLASGQTVGWVVIYREVTNDTDSVVVAVYDVTDTPTNGGNVSITIDSTGALRLSTV